MMVMKKTLIHIDDMVSLLRWQLTIFSDFIEIIMPLLAHFGFLSQGTRSIFRPYPTKPNALKLPLACCSMHFSPASFLKQRFHWLSIPYLSLPMLSKHNLRNPSFFDYRTACGC